MKRFVLEIGAGRPAAVKGKMQKPADKVKMAEALARMVDKNLLDAVSAAGKTLDSYVDCEVSFTADGKSGDGITIELEKDDWNSSKAIQTTPTIKLKGYRDNSVNITVPAGVTMHMTVDGEKETYAAGTTVEVFVGDPFYFTAPDTKTGTWSSGTLKASIAEFTAYMIKVSGKQNMAFAGVDNADITSLKIDWLDEGEGELYKSSKNTVIIKDNDNYSLAGGVFEVYDADGDLYGSMTTDEKGYANIKNIPYGTYTVKEKKAPKGYAKTDEVATLKITTPAAVAVDFANLPQNDILDIVVVKEDSETEKKLKDAIFEINFHAIDYMPGKAEIKRLEPQKTWTVVTDAEGVAKLKAEYLAEGYESDSFFKDSRGNICLPLGLVTVQEIKAPKGYLIHDELFVQRITSEGTLETVDVYNEHDVYDHIKRGNFEFIKVSEDNMKRMAGVPFKVTALDGQYKGESHIIVTDANGYYTSSAERNEHSGKTNANDAAYDEKNVDESKLDAASGLWFGPDDAVTDHRGALPYGRYRLDELRCEANMGHQLLKGVEFVISMDEVTVDLGTMMDKQILIGTQASDADTGKQMSYARDNYTLKDTVQLEGLERGETYTLKGVLMDKQTQQPLKASGKDVTSEVTFTAKAMFTGLNAVTVTASTETDEYVVIVENQETALDIVEEYNIDDSNNDNTEQQNQENMPIVLEADLSKLEATQIEKEIGIKCVEKDLMITKEEVNELDIENITKPTSDTWNFDIINTESSYGENKIKVYILATILFICFAVKSWVVYKEGNEKTALAELIGSVIASIGGLILIITFFVF